MSKHIIRRTPSSAAGSLPDDIAPVLRRIYGFRDITSADELDYSLQRLLPPSTLGGLDNAAACLAEVLTNAGRILVVGDFDADGATSVALCLRALRAMGARDVDYLVPNRFDFGYGLTPEIVQVAGRNKPDLIITVDNGISSIAGVQAAKDLGIRVIVTDHHLPGAQLPAADAIVNPNLPGDPFPSKALAGVGVAFYLMLGLRARLRQAGWFESRGLREPRLAALLDLVALGTVADVVPLDANNRLLVHQGLQRIRLGACVPGITALLEAGNRNPRTVVASDLGFAAGPRLNAAGRLEDMSAGIECLLTDSATDARRMAAQLDALNRERRDIEAGMQAQALETLEQLDFDDRGMPVGLCLFEPEWHQGVIGILAARIKERFHRPVIAFARSGEGELKGSARSVSGLHIRDAIDAVATRHPGLVPKFGGHAMAAGLSLAEDRYSDFAAAFDEEVQRHLAREELGGRVYSDGELPADELSLETAQLLRDAGPWGQGFPAPLFDGYFRVLEQRVVGEKHLKMVLQAGDAAPPVDAIAFNAEQLPPGCNSAHFAYRLEVNEFRGLVSPQLVVEHIDVSGGE